MYDKCIDFYDNYFISYINNKLQLNDSLHCQYMIIKLFILTILLI